MVQEVVGFRRPLVFLGQPQYSGQVPFQNNSQFRARGLQRDLIDQRTDGLVRAGQASVIAFQRLAKRVTCSR
jgi:hypothetical protein